MSNHYMFSYGMNCDPEHMQYESYCHPIGKATLVGWHLEVRCFANIVRGGEMEGVLWEIDDDTLESLDKREGYPSLYTRHVVNVFHETESYGAIVYEMNKQFAETRRDLIPATHYVISVLRGYKTFGIPVEQITNAINSLTPTLNYENK